MPRGSRKRKCLEIDGNLEAACEIFQKHFESHFEPLPQRENYIPQIDKTTRVGSDCSDEDEWSGISDAEEDNVEVVDHASNPSFSSQSMGKRELKAFMSSRPPTPLDQQKSNSKSAPPTRSLPEDSRTLLAQDLALHRLITESHLLNPLSKLHSKPFSEGRIRMHATDLRITQLAPTGTKSVLTQAKMPMAMRKGIKAASKGREEQRRREAWENGIVLERKGGQADTVGKKRKRPHASVDLPSIGTMRGAELRLSERDLKSIGDSSNISSRGSRSHTTPRRH